MFGFGNKNRTQKQAAKDRFGDAMMMAEFLDDED